MKKTLNTSLSVLLLIMLFHGCQKQPTLKTLMPTLPANPYSYYGVSCGFGSCGNEPVNNPTNSYGATLGRVLFYDPRLSLNNTVSCASCHRQANAFADNAKGSVGYEGKLTTRNSPGFINESLKSSFFWDGRSSSLEEMVLMPVQHHLEMGLDNLAVMEKKIGSISYYPTLFKKAFGTEEVTSERISFALAQFLRSMHSLKSKIDKGQLNQLEKEGQLVFMKFNCGQCHTGNNFGGSPFGGGGYFGNSPTKDAANIGLDVEYTDKGIRELDGNAANDGAFIIPSLRNLSYTAPYMHDGRYQTLEEVIEHYNSGIQPSAALDANLVDAVSGAPLKMNMTADEKVALAAFLRALSDPTITTDIRFSNPFE